MKIPADKKFWLLPVLLLLAISTAADKAKENKPGYSGTPVRLPAIMLWAWERPEDLSFINTTETGVAFLAKTIYLRANSVAARPRMQPLKMPAGTKLVAVARIEVDRREHAILSAEQLETTVAAIAELAKLPDVRMLQVDFDAVSSERDFYRSLIIELRRQLPSSIHLSITALASWCDGDNWISDLPLDEAVPMFFRMGVESGRFASRLESGSNFLAYPCRNAAGISTDERIPWPSGRRVYIFSPTSWTRESLNSVMEAREK
jgi:hypothetical protein